MRPRFVAEGEDVRVLALAAVAVPLTWWLLLGWSWPRSVSGHDELAQGLLWIREIAASAASGSPFVYRPDLLGGFKARDVVGPYPLVPLLAGLGLAPVAISIVTAFLVQSVLGFLGARTIRDVAGLLGSPRPLTFPEIVPSVWLCAFAPVLGWRLGYGHLNLVLGLLPFAAGLALLAASASGRLTGTLVAVASASFVLGLLHPGLQIVVYSVVFGGPILLGAWLSLGGGWRRLGIPLLTALGAAVVTGPVLWPMIAHARSSDAPRGFSETVVVFDFVRSTASDWITSIPWTTASLPAAREASLHHEVNYPAGPLLVLLALVPWRRTRALAAGLALGLLAALAFSVDLAPLSRAMLALIPPLRTFRVPARAILPWLWTLPILAAAALLQASPPPKKKMATRLSPQRALLLAAAIGGALFVAPSVVREAGAWLTVVVVVVARRRNENVPAAAVLVVLGVCSVAAFRERLLPFENADALLVEAEHIGDALRRVKPELESPLVRVRLNFEVPVFTVNTAFAAGLSSLDGYEVPTRRFAALLFALRGRRYEPTAMFFRLGPQEPAFRVLRQLYNVVWDVSLPSRGSMTVAEAGPAAGPGWFSASLLRTKDVESLSRELNTAGDALHGRAKEVLWLVDSDPLAVAAPLPSTVDRRCATARVVQVTASARKRDIVAEVETEAACPLTLATNFTEDLRATAVLKDGQEVAAPVFPGYGSLAGIVVPAGCQQVRLRAVPPALPWLAAAALGALLLASPATAQERTSTPAFATQAEAITVDVVVLDKEGHPVRDLTREDFTVLDDGHPQVVVGFEARTLTKAVGESEGREDGLTATNERARHGRRTFAFILDDLGTEPLHMTDGVKAVTSWLEHSADPRDEVTLLTTSGDAWWSDNVGRGQEDLIAVLRTIQGKKGLQDASDSMSEWESYRIDGYEGGSNPDVPDAQGVASLTVAPPNQECIRPHGSSAGDLAGRVVDRWMATKACQCEPVTQETILSSRQSCRARVAGTARALHRATLQRAQAMLGAIERLSRGLAGSSGRKSILVLSDGLVRDTQLEGFDAAVDATQRGNTAVSFVDLRGLAGTAAFRADQRSAPKEGDLASVDLEQNFLETAGTEYVASATGGSTVRDTNDLLGGLTRVADETSAYYLLGYQPDKPRDGKRHKLEVKVSRPGLSVRARRGYVASSVAPQAAAADRASDAAPQTGKGPKRPLDPGLMAGALDDAIPVRVAPYVLEPDGQGLARVRVTVEIDTSKISLEAGTGARRATLDLTLLGASRGRGKLVPVDERLRFDVDERSVGGWLTLSRDIHLPAGVALVRALVRDVATGRAGSVAQRFEVPPLNAPYLTTPVLTDRAQTPSRGFPQLLPVAHRRFRSPGVLYCQYGVEGLTDSQGRATLRVMGGHTLQIAGGPVVRIAPPTMIAMGLEGEIMRTFTLPLEGLPAGDYQLVIDVVDEATGRSLSAVQGFSVEAAASPAGE